MARAIHTGGQSTQPGNQLIEAAAILIKQQKYTQAESRLATLRNQLPGNTRIMALYGDVLRLQHRYDDAIVEYERAYNAGMRLPDLLLNLGQCYIKQMDGEKAMQIAQEFIKIQPRNPNATALKGGAHRLLRQPLEARDSLRKAIAMQPNAASFYQAIAHLDTFTADSSAFKVLKKAIDDAPESMPAQEKATLYSDLAKAYLDIDDFEQAFEYYAQANKLMDDSLPPIKAELERRLSFTRQYFTPSLYKQLSGAGIQSRPQMIIAGMSRSGKSLVESLFHGVKGVTLAGEEMVLVDFLKEILQPYGNSLNNWISYQSPESIAKYSQDYVNRLGADDKIKITTIPGDLWNLGLIGLLLPNVPIIFCVRDVLDLGITGFFQQYAKPEGYRYSYNLHHMGRQVGCSEKVMEHWAQVLPNPVYLVDYAALTHDPQTVMDNLLNDLGLERIQPYEEIIGTNAAFIDSLSPISSIDAPMPVSNRFNGIAQKFIHHLQPMVDGYKTIVDQFPRCEPPATFAHALPDVLIDNDTVTVNPSEQVEFNWQLPEQLVVIDNGGYLLRHGNVAKLMDLNAFGLVVFDPSADAKLPDKVKENTNFHYLPQTLLGNGQTLSLNVCLDASYNSTLDPLPFASIANTLKQPSTSITKIPVNSVALDAIDGIEHVDWLLLDHHHNSISILENGVNALSNTLVLQTGVSFSPTYQNQPSVAELMHWAARHGFAFHRFVAINHMQAMTPRDDLINQPEPSALQHAAMVFVPDSTRMKQLSDTQRLKLAFILDSIYSIYDLSYELLSQIGPQLGENYLKAKGFFDRKRKGPSWKELARVRKLIKEGDIVTAVRQIRYWSQRFSADPHVQRVQAMHIDISGAHDKAIALLNQAMQKAPEDLGIRLTGIEFLLHAGMWWEAQTMAETLVQKAPNNTHLMLLWWQAVAASAQPNIDVAQSAIEQISSILENNGNDSTINQPRLTAILARMHAHIGNFDRAQQLHQQSINSLGSLQGKMRAELLIEQAASLISSNQPDEACNVLWQACDTRPYSFYTVRAYRYFNELLPKTQVKELQNLISLHKNIYTIVTNASGADLKSTLSDFGLPYQAFEPLKLTGTRPTMQRLNIYGLDTELPENARALDVGCNSGFLLMGLAPLLSEGIGFDSSQSSIDIGNIVAEHLGHDHIQLECKTLEQFRTRKKFDLVLACDIHSYIDMSIEKLAARLYEFCNRGGLLLLESQGSRQADTKQSDYEEKFSAIASIGFELIRKGKLCDDAVHHREFWVLRKK